MSQVTKELYGSDIGDILENSLDGIRPGLDDCIRLLESDDVHLMGLVAGHLTRKKFGKKALNWALQRIGRKRDVGEVR